MHDNKVRLSRDVLEKAELIAKEWGLKNARAAVEAVFRRYSDEYLKGNPSANPVDSGQIFYMPHPQQLGQTAGNFPSRTSPPECEALDALDDVLAM